MSILIKGMEMPESCFYCPFVEKTNPDEYVCMARNEEFSLVFGHRDKDCPLVEIPPHDRLIDADAFEESISTLLQFPSDLVNGQWIVNTIREQPTIIEAEEVQK